MIQEYQNKLLVEVKDDVRALQERFKRKYAESEAARLARVRDLPPLTGSIIWARQVCVCVCVCACVCMSVYTQTHITIHMCVCDMRCVSVCVCVCV